MSLRKHPVSCLLSLLSLTGTTAVSAEELSQNLTSVRGTLENVQLTPESVTVIEAATQNETYRNRLEDIAALVPGMIVDRRSAVPGGASIALRGVDSDFTSPAFDPTVALVIDGVYTGTHAGNNPALFDYERIEVARNPQGGNLAAAGSGGAIYLTRSKPTGITGIRAEASVGQQSLRRFDVVGNTALPGQSGIKLKATLSITGGTKDYYENISRRTENDNDRLGFTLSGLWEYSDDFSLQYTYEREDDDSTTPVLLNLSDANDLVCQASVAAGSNDTCVEVAKPDFPTTGTIRLTTQNYANTRHYEGDYHTLAADLNWSGIAFHSITAWRSNNESSSQDLDASYLDYLSIDRQYDFDQFSQSLSAAVRLSDALRLRMGVDYRSSDYDLQREDHYIYQNLASLGLADAPLPGQNRQIMSSQGSDTTSVSGRLDYQLNPAWQADLALRWNHVDKTFRHATTHPGLTNPVLGRGNESWEASTGSAGLTYTVDETAVMYFRYDRAWAPGGYFDEALTPVSAGSFDSQSVHSWEIGLKTEWWDRKLRLNITRFNTTYDDRLQKYPHRATNGRIEATIGNASDTEIKGWETELEARPLDNLTLRGTWYHSNADFVRYLVPDLSTAGGFTDLSGQVPSRSPSDMFYLSTLYGFPLGEGRVNLFAAYRYQKEYLTNSLEPRSVFYNHTTLDLSVDYLWKEWTFRVFSQNLKDNNQIRNTNSLQTYDVVSLHPAASPQSIVTWAEYNEPRFSGIKVIYQPDW
ncbi:MAG: TonB-dependent receptor [Pseudomonadales bacterium]|nr:TonB-dependent receptor [Pseudomonadales bacterium]